MKKNTPRKTPKFSEAETKRAIREAALNLAHKSLDSNNDPHLAHAALIVYQEAK